MEKQIQYINVYNLSPHPDNPRKDLGDLTELSESIKSQGVLQNITVVPREQGSDCSYCKKIESGNADKCKGKTALKIDENTPCPNWENGGYYIIIMGHRRHAAAEKAGLKEVPCVIVEMTPMEQVETMLVENMQRADLTPTEQAQGFQMMLDMGATVKDVAKKTGFSETTVRNRIFIASLNSKQSRAAESRGAKIEDYLQLQKLTDKKRQNEVLKTVGTNNFNQTLSLAIAEELRDRVSPSILKQIEVFANPTEIDSWYLKGYNCIYRIGYETYEIKKELLNFKFPKKWESDEYLYKVGLRLVEIFQKNKDVTSTKKMNELPPKEQELRREERRKYRELKELAETTYQLRYDFVKSFPAITTLKKDEIEALANFSLALAIFGQYINYYHMAEMFGVEFSSPLHTMRFCEKEGLIKTKATSVKLLLATLYSVARDGFENKYFFSTESLPENKGRYKKNEILDAIYDCFCAFGYEMSDDEQKLRDGTHELFVAGGKKT